MTSPSSQPRRSMSKKARWTSVALPPQGQVLLWASLALQTASMFLPEASTLIRLKGTLRGRLRRVLPYPPGILARGPWPPDRVSSRWSETRYEPPPEKAAAADRAIAELRGRGSPSHDGLAARLAELHRRRRRAAPRAPGDALGAAAARDDAVGRALGAVRRARPRGPLARRPARGVGRDAGRACGRSAPAAPSTRARTRRSRSAASCEEEWCGRARADRGRGADRDARRHGDADRPGVARAGRRGHARPRARRARLVAARPGRVARGGTSATPAPGTLLVMAAPVSFRTLKYLSFTHSAIYTRLLIVAITGGLRRREVRARLGARHRLDRHVAALHRRRPAPRDPALARRDGRGRRWRRPVCGHHRVPVCRAACKSAARIPNAIWSRTRIWQ